jgi:hypothetical protein
VKKATTARCVQRREWKDAGLVDGWMGAVSDSVALRDWGPGNEEPDDGGD